MYNMTPIKSSTMYVPQDEHLQPEECNIIIRDLKEVTMQACTRKERLARTTKNRENTKRGRLTENSSEIRDMFRIVRYL